MHFAVPEDQTLPPVGVSLINSVTAATVTSPRGFSSAVSYKKLVMHEGALRRGEHRSSLRISKQREPPLPSTGRDGGTREEELSLSRRDMEPARRC